MSDDLVTRLRYAADRARGEYPEVFRVSEEIAYEAADRIEQLTRSSEGWKEIADEYFDAIGERNTRIEKLEAALREIAALGYWDGDSAMNIARKALEGKDD